MTEPPCTLAAHFAELQALCDALGHAAQLEMTEAILRDDALGRELAYGKWLGVRGLLRALEQRWDEWTPAERAMLERISETGDHFRFPGRDAFEVALTEPGSSQPAVPS
jgi:hypothetical protein